MNDIAVDELVLEITRHFAVAPERVFDAWVSSEWASWLPPAGATCELVVHDPRPGGRFETKMLMPDGRSVKTSGTYREIERPRRLVFSWMADYAGVETTMALTFEAEAGGTRMTLRQTGFPNSDMRDGYMGGWNGSGGAFDKLATRLRERG